MSTTTQSARILQAPLPDMVDSKSDLYRFLLEIYNRTGGYQQSTTDLKGLTASVRELNTLEGVRIDTTVQAQLNSKMPVTTFGTMAFQDAINVAITGGAISGVNLSSCNGNALIITSSSFSNGSVNSCSLTTTTGSATIAKSNGVINSNFTTAGNSLAVETDLLSYSLLASTLGAANSYLEVTGFGSFAANANNKRLRLKFGTSTIYDSTA